MAWILIVLFIAPFVLVAIFLMAIAKAASKLMPPPDNQDNWEVELPAPRPHDYS